MEEKLDAADDDDDKRHAQFFRSSVDVVCNAGFWISVVVHCAFKTKS